MYTPLDELPIIILGLCLFGYVIWYFAKGSGYNERCREEWIEKHSNHGTEPELKQSVCKRQELPRIFQVSDAELEEAKKYFEKK
jgi:hypothetical protein